MSAYDFATVPVIITVVYGIVSLLKKETGYSERVLKALPIAAAFLGAVLGVIAFFAAPALIPADNVFVALLIGGASGLAATGTNQIFKQLKKNGDETAHASKVVADVRKKLNKEALNEAKTSNKQRKD